MKRTILLLCVIALIFSFLSGCLFNEYEEYSLDIEYTLRIIPEDNNTSYQIYCPIPITREGEISRITENINVILGSVEFSFENTLYGNAINITGKESCELSLTINRNHKYDYDNSYPFLSMDKEYELTGEHDPTDLNSESYVFLSWNSSQSIHLYIHYDFNYIDKSNVVAQQYAREQTIEGDIQIGWNMVSGKKTGHQT